MLMSLILAYNVPMMGGEAQPVGAARIEAFALGTLAIPMVRSGIFYP